MRAAINNLITMFRKGDVASRRLSIDALAAMADGSTIEALQEALADEDREVRIAAARGLSNTRVPASREKLKNMVRSRALRFADLTEQMAIFEAYGAVAVEEDIAILDRLLNGRRLLGKETPEIRACAAMALGRITQPAARSALMEASRDPHPMVRNAVSKALSQARAG
jgi:HEAT repeat protein